jgi:hypothetical protein
MTTLKKATLLVAFFLLFTAPTKAQEPADLEMTSRIVAEGLERSQVLAVYTHLTDAHHRPDSGG